MRDARTLPAVADNATITAHVEAAKSYMENQQWDYASYEWRNVLSQDPANLHAIEGLAKAMMHSGMPEEAVKFLEESRRKKARATTDLSIVRRPVVRAPPARS